MISKEQYRKVLLKQIDENTQKKNKEKEERKSQDKKYYSPTFFRKRQSRIKSFCQEKCQQSSQQNNRVCPSPKVLHSRSQSKQRSKSGLLYEHQQTNYCKKKRNLLYWQNVDKQTIEQNIKKKNILKQWLTYQINENKEKKLRLILKQKVSSNKIQQLFKFNDQNQPPKKRKRALRSNNLLQQTSTFSAKFLEIERIKSSRLKTQVQYQPYVCPQQKSIRLHTVSQIQQTPTSKLVLEMQNKILLIKKELQNQKNNHITQLQKVKIQALKVRQQKNKLQNQFKKLKKFVKYKLNVNQTKRVQDPPKIHLMEYTFREQSLKNQFYNESILNSSKQISNCQSELLSILQQPSKKIIIDKNKKSNLLLAQSYQLSHSISSQTFSLHLTHLQRSQNLDKF